MFGKIVKSLTGAQVVEEHKFHPKRKWRFDYAIVEDKIAIEVEGGIWRKGGGAHSRPTNIVRDIEKYNEAVRLGWRLIRVQPEKLNTSYTLNLITDLLKCAA